jgi:hypothetical protein
MSDLIKLRSPTGEIVEATVKNAKDLVQHHNFVKVGSPSEEAEKAKTNKAHGKRTPKTRDDETAERLKLGEKKEDAPAPVAAVEAKDDKPKRGRPKKVKDEAPAPQPEPTPEISEADMYDDGFDDLEAEEESRGNRDSDLD